MAEQSFDAPGSAAASGLHPVVISRQCARRFFGGTSPIGQVVEIVENAGPKPATIISIVADREVCIADKLLSLALDPIIAA